MYIYIYESEVEGQCVHRARWVEVGQVLAAPRRGEETTPAARFRAAELCVDVLQHRLHKKENGLTRGIHPHTHAHIHMHIHISGQQCSRYICKSMNRSHTQAHTPTENNIPDTDTQAHDKNNTPNPQTNTSHKHLTALEGYKCALEGWHPI